MFVKTEINDFEAIEDMAWYGAVPVCQEIIRQEREAEAMCLIEEMFGEYIPTETQLNDFIRFELGDIMHLWDAEYEEEDE